MNYFFNLFLLLIAISTNAQTEFKPVQKSQIKDWLKEAAKSNEIDKSKLSRLWEIHADLDTGSKDANHVYNFGRIIADALQPGFRLQNHDFTAGAIQLMVQAELAYRFAISECKCHGRANIMLGLLYNQQKKYYISEPYLEKGLQLPEGSDDWMIAANQYLLAGAYTYNTKNEKYLKVYKRYKKYASKHKNPYYQKMATMYIPYYEQ
jgi:hypothetical protein